jgi:hypothetical protein
MSNADLGRLPGRHYESYEGRMSRVDERKRRADMRKRGKRRGKRL